MAPDRVRSHNSEKTDRLSMPLFFRDLTALSLRHLRFALAFLAVLSHDRVRGEERTPSAVPTPRVASEWVHAFDPNTARTEHKGEWYCNDHTFVRDSNGVWHAYGIIGYRPAQPWKKEKQFFHATSKSLGDPSAWNDHGNAMTALAGKEAVIWAPHSRLIDDQIWMFYNVGNLQPTAEKYASWGGMCIARSRGDDGFTWERDSLNPLFADHGHARDSFVTRFGDRYHWYYTRTATEIDLRSAVAVRTSPDLVHWSGPRVVQLGKPGGHWAGNCESPQVIQRGPLFYLFVTAAMEAYDKTLVYWSHDPLSFPKSQLVTQLKCHAPEVFQDEGGDWYISDCGWSKAGLYLAKLEWGPED
jgi:hypothetical protein